MSTSRLHSRASPGSTRRPGWRARPFRSRRRRSGCHAICQWDAEKSGLEIRLRSIYDRSGFLCTAYAPTNYYHGGEGELYDVRNDPRQWENLWDDPDYRAVRDELVGTIREAFPEPRTPPLERRSRT